MYQFLQNLRGDEEKTKTMNLTNERTTMEIAQAILKHRDNLFNANHRRLMIERFGATEAQFIKIEDLL